VKRRPGGRTCGGRLDRTFAAPSGPERSAFRRVRRTNVRVAARNVFRKMCVCTRFEKSANQPCAHFTLRRQSPRRSSRSRTSRLPLLFSTHALLPCCRPRAAFRFVSPRVSKANWNWPCAMSTIIDTDVSAHGRVGLSSWNRQSDNRVRHDDRWGDAAVRL